MPDEPQGTPPPGGWLPPEDPAGPAPGGGPPGGGPYGAGSLGGPPPPAGGPPPGQPPPAQPSPYSGQPPQYSQQPYQQAPHWGQYGQQYPYQQPAPYQQPSPWASTYYWKQAEPDNSPAVAGFIMSLASLATLVMFFGFLSPINLGVSIAAAVVSRNGIKKVESGETTRNKDLAKWGFWLGIVGAVLAALVILLFILVIASAPEWADDLDTSEPR